MPTARRGQRQGAGDRAEIGEPYPHCHRPTKPGFGPKAAPDTVGEMTERRPEDALRRGLLAERRLRSRRRPFPSTNNLKVVKETLVAHSHTPWNIFRQFEGNS